MDCEHDPGLPVTPAAELRAVFDDDATDHCRHQRVVALEEDRASAIGHVELTASATARVSASLIGCLWNAEALAALTLILNRKYPRWL